MNETFGERVKRLREQAGLTQVQLARMAGMAQSTLNGLENGRNQTTRRAQALAGALRVDLQYLFTGKTVDKRRAEPPVQPNKDMVTIPLINAVGSAGPGDEHPDHEMVIDQIRFSRQWLSKTIPTVTAIGNLALITALGDSMSPTINNGDVLLVDSGIKHITIDGVYVMRAHSRLYIKRVRQRMLDGSFIVSSDNPAAGTPEELNGKHKVEVLGRVVWAWNGRPL